MPYFEIGKREVVESVEWHWMLWSASNRMLARSAVPYKSRKATLAAIKTAREAFSAAIEVVMNECHSGTTEVEEEQPESATVPSPQHQTPTPSEGDD